jgi:hypothetical protein
MFDWNTIATNIVTELQSLLTDGIIGFIVSLFEGLFSGGA